MLLRALFWRPLRKSPLRFLATVLGVSAGVALFVATRSSSRAAIASLREGVLEVAGEARLEITASGGVDERLLGELRDLSRHAVLLPVIEEIVVCGPDQETARLLGIDPLVDEAARGFLARSLESTRHPDTARREDSAAAADAALALLRGEGAWLASSWAESWGWKVGDAIELTLRAKPVRLPILGLFETPHGTAAWERVIVVDVAYAQELAGRVGRLDRIELVPRPGVDVEELAKLARERVPKGCVVDEPARRGRETTSMVRSLEFNLTALSGISLFVGAVLVATTLASSIVERRETLSLLVSLGAGRGQLLRAILIEALAIGLSGGVAGVALGHFGSSAVLAGVRSSFSTIVPGAPATPIQFHGAFALLGVLSGVAIAVLAALAPAWEAASTPPIQGWRPTRTRAAVQRSRRIALALALILAALAFELIELPPIGDLPVPALAGLMSLLCALCALGAPLVDLAGSLGRKLRLDLRATLPLALAAGALARGRRRAAWAASAIGVAAALSISIATLVHSFRGTVVDWTRTSLRADLSIRPVGTSAGLAVGRLDPEIVDIAEREFGPGVVDPFYATKAYLGTRRITFAGAALDVASEHGGVPFRDGRASEEVFRAARGAHRALVNEAFANRFGVMEGDSISISVRGGTLQRTVEGVFYDYGDSQGLVVLDRSEFLVLYPDEGPHDIALFLPEDIDAADTARRIEGALLPKYRIEVIDQRSLQARVLEIFDRTFAITSTMETVASAVAVIAVLSVLFALVWERKDDLALLCALGASKRTVAAIVCTEAGVLGFIGAASGAVTGLVMGVVLVTVVNLQSFGWTLHTFQPWAALATMVVGVVVSCLAAGLWPAAWVARHNLHEGLRDDA